jgi:imidazolonepropionase-like amidohydrolase
MRMLHARVRDTIGAAIEARIPVYAGSDAGGGIRHGRVVDEIAALRTAGLTGAQALAAASWAARDWLGAPGLVPGAPADLLVTSTDPRLDPDALRHPVLLLLRGRAVGSMAAGLAPAMRER